MGVTIGIDIGGSTTKIVGMQQGRTISPIRVRADDPVTSAYGAFGKFLAENQMDIGQVDKVRCTGVGSSLFRAAATPLSSAWAPAPLSSR